MQTHSGLFVVIVTLLIFTAPPSVANLPTDETAANKTRVTASYNEPQGWDKFTSDDVVKFDAEEKDAVIAVMHITEAKNAEDAAKKAWLQLDPTFSRNVRTNIPREVSDGWDDKRRIEYVTSVAEHIGVYAYTHELDESWHVILVRGDAGTINKRGAAIWELVDSFRVSGFVPEDLSDVTAKKLTEAKIKELLAFIESSAEALNVPGVGVSLSQNGKVVYQGGIGLANIDEKQPVTADTLFMVASNTKGMATLLLAKLVEMGKLNWQDKVVEHYPDFKLGDDETTQSVRIEHLVCACTGLPRRDLGWVFNNEPTTPVEVLFDDLASTQPTSEFGKIFQYSNELAAAAGYVAGHVLYPDMDLGEAFDKAMREHIFKPLNMDNTVLSIEAALKSAHASPYADDLTGKISPIEQTQTRGFNHTVHAYRPAGGAWSSPADMIKYVQNELSEGIGPDGKRLFAKEPLLARRAPYVSTGENEHYGMGLATKTFAGITMVNHGGSLAGYMSNWYAFPKANVGLVVLTNSDEGWYLLEPTARKLMELLYDAESRAAKQIEVAAETQRLNKKNQQDEFIYPGNQSVLDNLARRYVNESLGELRVYQKQNDTYVDPGVWRTPVGTKQNADGTTSIVAIAPFLLGLEFLVEQVDNKKALTIKYGQSSYTFLEDEQN